MAEEDIIGFQDNPHARKKLEEIVNIWVQYFDKIIEKNKLKKSQLRREKLYAAIKGLDEFKNDMKKDIFLFKNRAEFKDLRGAERDEKKKEILGRLSKSNALAQKTKEATTEKTSLPDLKEFVGLSGKKQLLIFQSLTSEQKREFGKKLDLINPNKATSENDRQERQKRKDELFKKPPVNQAQTKQRTSVKQKGFTR